MSSTAPTTGAHPFLTHLAPLGQRLAGRGPEWLRRFRRENLSRFQELGFPTTRLEEWKNTNVSSIARTTYRPAQRPFSGQPPAETEQLPFPANLELGGPRLSVLDGHAGPSPNAAGTRGGLWAGGLARALEEQPEGIAPYLLRRSPAGSAAFCALNGAFFEDGAAILIPQGVRLAQPLLILYGSSARGEPTLSQPRTLIVAGAGSESCIVEIFFGMGPGEYLTNTVSDVFVEDNASLEHYRLQCESPRANHVFTCSSRQGRDSRYTSFNIHLGGRLVRHDLEAVLDGEGATCRLYGLVLTHDSQHVDNHTVIDHAKPHGASREVYKGILDDQSRTVFNGRIIVRPGAQKTDAKQSNPNLVLSSGALAHTRPQLEIYADDVKCTHGATVGRLDENAIFYLQSRGIDRQQAQAILVRAFAGEILEAIGVTALRSHLEQVIDERLNVAGR